MKKKIIVTGGAGFIGSHCVDHLIDKGYHVINIDNLSFGIKQNINSRCDFIKMDLSDFDSVRKIIASTNPSHIFHFAANATTKSTSMGWKNPFDDYKINMVGTLNILESIKSKNLKTHLIYASTAAVYGEPKKLPINELHETLPISPYGISKLSGEKYCYAYGSEFGINYTVLRIFNTYGPRQPRYVMYDQIKNIMNNKTGSIKILGTGNQLRDYAYVSDTIDAFIGVMDNPEKTLGKTFNIAGGNKISIRDLIKELKLITNKNELLENYTGKSWKGDIDMLWANTESLENAISWSPKISLNHGLNSLYKWVIKSSK